MRKTTRRKKVIRKARTVWGRVSLAVFLAVTGGLLAAGADTAARPVHSDLEKRNLARMPDLSPEGLWDGSWFDGLTAWYADTYPLREQMMAAQARVETAYGPADTQVVVMQAREKEEIPDASEVKEAPELDLDAIRAAQEEAAAASSDASADEQADAEVSGASDTQEPAQEEEETYEDGALHNVQPEQFGTVYIAGGRAFNYYYFDSAALDTYASMINTVAAQLPDVNVYCLTAPNNFGIMLDDDTQKSLAQSEREGYAYLYSRLSAKVKKVDVFDTLVHHNAEYIYFRTDHHWTQLGAYYAYRDFCEVKGIEPEELDTFATKEFDGFLGSFYAASDQSAILKDNADTILAYIPHSTNTTTVTFRDGTQEDYEIIGNGPYYSIFSASDQPFECMDNPDLSDGSSIILLKDSYGDAFAPFLVDHYDKVYLVDYRYYNRGPLKDFIAQNGVTDILFMNDIEFIYQYVANDTLALFGF